MNPAAPTSDPHGGRAATVRWELLDIAFLVYLGVVVLLLFVLGVLLGNHEEPWRWILYNVLIGAVGMGARALPRIWRHPVAYFLRWWYPVLLLFASFKVIGGIIHLVRPEFLDEVLYSMDRLLFGRDLTVWMQANASPWFTEVMYFFYSSFYFLPAAVGIPIFVRAYRSGNLERDQHLREFMAAVSLTFYFSYVHFLFTPAVGPIFWAGYPVEVLRLPGGPITTAEQWLFHNLGVQGGAFPSSHVAASLVICHYAVRYRIAPAFFVVVAIGLGISTMYNGYHYAVDVLYGLLVATLMIMLIPRLLEWYERRFLNEIAQRPSRSASVLK